MADYTPPTENLPIFDSTVFLTGDEPLTYNDAKKRFLRYPNAQGTENLQTINVNGVATFNNDVVVGSATSTNLTPQITTNKSQLNLGTGGNGLLNVECPISVGGFGSIQMASSAINMQSGSYIVQGGMTTPNTLGTTNLTAIANYSGVTQPATSDNSTKIPSTSWVQSVISSIGPGSFAPKFANYMDYQTGTSGYSQGTKMICGGTWGPDDYVIFRVTAQINWTDTGTGWQNLATTSGQLVFRPYYAPSGTWSSNGSNTAVYPTNSNNSNFGSVQKAVYYLGSINNGSTGFFFLWGYGGSGGGSAGSYIQLCATAPGSTGGWAYSHLLEYICNNSTAGTITLQGISTSGSNNNYLP